MKEVRKCEQCQNWFKKEDTEEVSVGSNYHPRYSSIEAYTSHTTVPMCKKCIEILFNIKTNG